MKTHIKTIIVSISLLSFLGPSPFTIANRQSHDDANTAFGAVILGSVGPDTDDPTVTVRIKGKEGILVRAQSIWESKDGGATWNVAATPPTNPHIESFGNAWVRNTADVFLVANSTVYETSDQGRSWTAVSKLRQMEGDFLAVAGDESGSWLATVGSHSLAISNKELSSLPKYADDDNSTSRSPRMLVPAVITSHNQGKTWQSAHLLNALGPLNRIVVNGNNAVALGPYAIFISSDKGASWSRIKNGVWNVREESYPVSAAIFGNRVWVSLKNGILLTGLTSNDYLSLVSNSSGQKEGLTFTRDCIGFAINEGQLISTRDGGVTWREVANADNVVALSAMESAVFAATHEQILEVQVREIPGTGACF